MNKKENITLITILFFAFLFRTLGTGTPALNGDEGDLYDSILDVVERNISPWQRWAGLLPPLSTWTTTIITRIFGMNEWALRFYGAIFGTLSVGIIYLLAKLHYNHKIASFAAIFSATLPLFVLSNRDAHPDNVLFFFSLLSILFFEYAYFTKGNIWYVFGGVSAGFAVLSKMNSLVLFAFYWLFIILETRKDWKKTFKQLVLSVLCACVIIALSFVGNSAHPFYFVHGLIYWFFNQSIGTTPWYYSISVLFDGLSPVLFFLFPVSILYALRERKRNDLLHVTLCFLFLLLVTFQGRKYPRHFLLALPFGLILVAHFISKRKQFIAIFLTILAITSTAGWSLHRINQHQNYTVWKDVGQYVVEHSTSNATLFVDGIEYWTLKYYTNYELVVVSKLKQELVNKGDIIIVHKLDAQTPFFIGSPLQNDLSLYTPTYGKQYKWNISFYEFTQDHGTLLKEFPYDKYGNTIAVYSIHTAAENKTDTTTHNLDLFTQRICTIWQSCSTVKYVLYTILPQELRDHLTKKCTQGCVWTCDVM